jgi:outer membrane murein-binding lipoprotein Lpp
MRLITIATFLLALLLFPGCETIRDGVATMVGAPTSTEVRDTAAKLKQAEEDVEKLDERRAQAEREAAKVKASEDRIAQRREVLERMQSELAGKLATAPSEARPILLASIREVDAQLEGLTNESAAIARLLADYDEEGTRLEIAAAKARRELAEHEATLDGFAEATGVAITRTAEGVKALGGQLSGLGVPGAGAVASQVSGILETGLAAILGGGSIGTLVAVRSRRKHRELEDERDSAVEERDGARRVIAVTERYGIDKIATDDSVRKQAKAAIAADEVARREYALAKAEA